MWNEVSQNHVMDKCSESLQCQIAMYRNDQYKYYIHFDINEWILIWNDYLDEYPIEVVDCIRCKITRECNSQMKKGGKSTPLQLWEFFRLDLGIVFMALVQWNQNRNLKYGKSKWLMRLKVHHDGFMPVDSLGWQRCGSFPWGRG